MGIKHSQYSSKPNSSNSSIISSNAWNADHTIDADVDFSGFDLSNQANVFRPEDYGAVGDGSTDDMAAFTRLSAAVNANGGGRVSFGQGKTYLVGNVTNFPADVPTGVGQDFGIVLYFYRCNGLVIDFNGASLTCPSASITQGYFLYIEECLDVRVNGLRGSTPNQSGATANLSGGFYGAYVIGTTAMENFVFTNTHLDAIHAGFWLYPYSGGTLYNVKIENAYIANGLYGIVNFSGPHYQCSFTGIYAKSMFRNFFFYNSHGVSIDLVSDTSESQSIVTIDPNSGDAPVSENIDIKCTYVNNLSGGAIIIDPDVGTIRNVSIDVSADCSTGSTVYILEIDTSAVGGVLDGLKFRGSLNMNNAFSALPIGVINPPDTVRNFVVGPLQVIGQTGFDAIQIDATGFTQLVLSDVQVNRTIALTNVGSNVLHARAIKASNVTSADYEPSGSYP